MHKTCIFPKRPFHHRDKAGSGSRHLCVPSEMRIRQGHDCRYPPPGAPAAAALEADIDGGMALGFDGARLRPSRHLTISS